MEIGEKIRKLRQDLGISQQELANRLGLTSRATVNKIEKGYHDLTRDKVELCARALGCTPAYLMGWEEDLFVPISSDIIELDIYNNLRIRNNIFGADKTGEKVTIPMNQVKKYPISEIFAYKVETDMMFPKILNGDTIIIHRTNEIKNHKIALYINNENLKVYLARVEKANEDTTLIPSNSMYSSRIYVGDEINELTFIGEVIFLVREL